MYRCLSRTALLTISLGLATTALAQQSPLPTGVRSGNTVFTPNVPQQAPVQNAQNLQDASYQSNLTRGQETGAVPAGGALPPGVGGIVAPGVAPGMLPPSMMDTGPKTAAEQGYDPEALAAEAAARLAAEEELHNTPRQRGERIKTPSYRDTVAKDPSLTEWLINWKKELVAVGVHPDKVDFEAGRLPNDQFALWASRMVWALGGDHSGRTPSKQAEGVAVPAPSHADNRPAHCCDLGEACCR